MANPVMIDPQIMGGMPCFAGTRVPAKSLFDHLKLGYTVEGFLEQFPTIRREQVDAIIRGNGLLIDQTGRPPGEHF